MKKILEHLQQNWIRYGFESVAILVSILAAFALNNWNEARKDKKEELALLLELRSDLIENKREIDHILQILERSRRSTLSLIYCGENNTACDNLNIKVLLNPSTGIFNSATTAFKNLESGGMNVLSNDSLRNKISRLYNNHFYNIHKREDWNSQRYFTDLMRLRNKYFKVMIDTAEYGNRNTTVQLIDRSGFQRDLAFQNTLHSLAGWYGFRKNWIDRAKEELEVTLEMIEDEIGLFNN